MPDRMGSLGDREQLADLAERLLGGVASIRLSPGQLAAVRWQLCRQLLSHLGSEDRRLYPHAARGRRVEDLQSAFGPDGELPFRAFLDYWTSERIAADSPGFCADTIRLLSILLGSIAEERRRNPSSRITLERRSR